MRKEPELENDYDLRNLKNYMAKLVDAINEMYKSMATVSMVAQISHLKAENERLRHEITAWETKYEAIKEVVNR